MQKIIVSSLAAFMLLTACQQPQQTPPAATPDQETPRESGQRIMKPVGDFHYDAAIYDYEGTLYLEGAANIVQLDEGFCDENCKKFDYVFFQFTPEYDAENKDFQAFMEGNEGNTFAGGNRIAIGCVEEGTISRMHWPRQADPDNIFVRTVMEKDEAEKILDSSADAPILLKLTRDLPDPSPGGSGAPDCYSHFNGVELVTIPENV